MARLGQMATGVAGNMLLEGARQLAQGKRPNLSDLLLTPANVSRVTQQLAQMRGAAMKLGQLISMDGDRAAMRQALLAIGYFSEHTQPQHQSAVLSLCELALTPLRLDRDFWHIPPIDTLFLHRKLGGLYLLAARLKARVNVQQLVREYESIGDRAAFSKRVKAA